MNTLLIPAKSATVARPFLKWAGGKMQLLSQFEAYYPADLGEGKIKRYVEPFLGSGAVFMHIIQNYKINEAYLSDINAELILVYKIVQQHTTKLLEMLGDLQSQYYSHLADDRSSLFYDIRESFNRYATSLEIINLDRYAKEDRAIQRAAYLIFLNKTCFNGLYRVNKKGEFNVPFGRYAKPLICDEENIKSVSDLLQFTELRLSEYSECAHFVNDRTFVYFDPPYRPLSQTSSFTTYSTSVFSDQEQEKLAQFFLYLHNESGAKLMLSNSDPKNVDPNDDFFEQLYSGFKIDRVFANRMINSNASRRGKISELVITNYR